MSRQYDFTLGASVGVSQLMHVSGNRVRLVSTPGGPVRVKLSNGDAYDLEAGQGFRLDPGKGFRELVVSNINGVAQTGSIFIGDDTFEDVRIPGQVQVLDGSAASTASDVEFIGSYTLAGTPAAGQYSQVQLWNGSTTNGLQLTSLVCMFSTLAQTLRFRINGAEMTPSTAVQIGSKRTRTTSGSSSSGASVGIRYRNTGANASGNDVGALLGGFNFPLYVPAGAAQTTLPGLDKAPILIAPQTGLIIAAEVAQSDFQLLLQAQIKPWVYG